MPRKKGATFNHDRLFKDSMGDLKLAKDILATILPADFLALMELDSLALYPTEYIQAYSNKQIIADMIYSVKTRAHPDSLIFLHLEAQSAPDPTMPLRLVETATALKRQYQKNHQNDPYLPLVIPVIVYTGTKPYTYSTSLLDYVDPELREYYLKILTQPPIMVQTKDIPFQDLLAYHRGALLWYGLQHAYDSDWIQAVEGLILLVNELSAILGANDPTLLRVFQSVLIYLAHHNKQPVSFDALDRQLGNMRKTLPHALGETMMSVRDIFVNHGLQQGIQQGVQQGVQQGIQQGVHQGMEQGVRKVALNMLKKGFPEAQIAECTGLSIRELDQFKLEKIIS